MRSAEELLEEVGRAFPPISKPDGTTLSFHPSGCAHCDVLRQYLEQYRGTSLPNEAVSYLHDDLSCLSASGWKWVMPSYLRRCITQVAEADAMETEYLIYNLAPDSEFKDETRQRLGGLSTEQLHCLRHFLEWCAASPRWSGYCAKEIANGLQFVDSLLGAKSAA